MIRRILGALLVVIGMLGIVLSGLAVVQIWRAAESVERTADENLSLLSDTHDDVDRSLDVTSTTLDSAALALDGLHATAVDVSQTLSTTQMTIDEMAQLTQDDLPQSIESSLTALDTLEETAELIDQLLRSLNQFGVGNYDPQVPLDRAVAMASQELNTIPDGLRAMAVGLTRTNANLKGVQDGVLSMADHIVNINGNVSDADEIVATHRETMRRFREQLETLRRNLDRSVRVVAWGLTLLLIWVGLSQLAIVQWGLGLWRRPPSETKVRSGDRANGAQ